MNEFSTGSMSRCCSAVRCWMGRRLSLPIAVLLAAVCLMQVGHAQRRSAVMPPDRNGVPLWEVDPEFKDDVFTFVRIKYNSTSRWGRWTTDYPDAELNFS